jgi:hypothetical protein
MLSLITAALLLAATVALLALVLLRRQRMRLVEDTISMEALNKVRCTHRATSPINLLAQSWKQSVAEKAVEMFDLQALGYDPMQSGCLARFSPVKQNTHCVFAKVCYPAPWRWANAATKTSRLAGCREWVEGLSLEQNVALNAEPLAAFLRVGLTQHLDGFLLAIPHAERFASSPEQFGETVRVCLSALSARNPRSFDCMARPDAVGRRAWYFDFGMRLHRFNLPIRQLS